MGTGTSAFLTFKVSITNSRVPTEPERMTDSGPKRGGHRGRGKWNVTTLLMPVPCGLMTPGQYRVDSMVQGFPVSNDSTCHRFLGRRICVQRSISGLYLLVFFVTWRGVLRPQHIHENQERAPLPLAAPTTLGRPFRHQAEFK